MTPAQLDGLAAIHTGRSRGASSPAAGPLDGNALADRALRAGR